MVRVLLACSKYFLENNTNRIPINYETKDEYNLYTWISNQKKAYREGTLSPARALMLTELGISFDRVRTRHTWEKSYEKVKEYYETYGDLKTLTLSEFRKRLIILQERNVLFCNEDELLHPIFSMPDEEIQLESLINERSSILIRTLKKDETPIE